MEGRGLCAAPDNAAKQILATAIVSPSHQLSYYNGNHTVSWDRQTERSSCLRANILFLALSVGWPRSPGLSSVNNKQHVICWAAEQSRAFRN